MVASTVVGVLISGAALAQAGRDYIYIVGSSTVYPFSTVVAERFGRFPVAATFVGRTFD